MTIIPPSSSSFRVFVRPSSPPPPVVSLSLLGYLPSLGRNGIIRSLKTRINPWLTRRVIGSTVAILFVLGILGYYYYSYSLSSLSIPSTPGVVRIVPSSPSTTIHIDTNTLLPSASPTILPSPSPIAPSPSPSSSTLPLSVTDNEYPYCNRRLQSFSGTSVDATASTTTSTEGIHIVIIGDSVDRLLVLEWCRQYPKERSLCLGIPDSNPPGIYDRQSTDRCTHFDERLYTILQLPDSYIELVSPVYCYDHQRNISLLMVWNRLGVNGAGPWHYNMTANPPIDPTIDPYHGIERFMGPLIRYIPTIMGYPPNVLMVQSLYWDLARLQDHDFATLKYARYYPNEWITNDYLPNMTIFLQVMKDYMVKTWYPSTVHTPSSLSFVYSRLLWMGWRTSNFVQDTGDKETSTNWRIGANLIIERVNTMVRESVQKRTNFCQVLSPSPSSSSFSNNDQDNSQDLWERSLWDYADLQNFPGSTQLRDAHHPIPSVTTGFINQFVNQLRQCQQEELMGSNG